MNRTQKKRLSYVVPGYVWQQGDFKFDFSSVKPVLNSGRGVIVISSQSVPRREYLAASLLAYVQDRDYHADVGWTSFFPREENEFTSSLSLPKHKETHVIAVKTDLHPHQMEQVQDLAVSCKLSIIACDQIQLYVPYNRLILSASSASKVII
jgi:hypothetical protein